MEKNPGMEAGNTSINRPDIICVIYEVAAIPAACAPQLADRLVEEPLLPQYRRYGIDLSQVGRAKATQDCLRTKHK